MTATGPFQASLSSLGTGTTYYYRAEADGGVNGINYGAEMNFTTLRIAPLVATGNASSLTSSSATLNGSLANMGAASTVNVSLQWGTTQGGPYPNSTTPQPMTLAGPFSAGLNSLAAKTTYYFRAKADGGASGIAYGAENSFTTEVVQPTVETNGATGIAGDSAVLNGNLIAIGTAATVGVSFCYGLNPGDLNYTAWQTLIAPGSFQANLTGLTPDTLYYFRAVAQGDGSAVNGAELTFRTSRIPPTVTTNGVTTPVGITTARLNGTLTSLGSSNSDNVSFQWGTTPGMYSAETTPQSMSTTGDFLADLGGLTPATTYYYRAKANGGIAGIGYGDEHSFTTSYQPPSATTNNASQLTTNSAMLNGSLDGLGNASPVNVSFQWGTTRGGPYPNSTAPQARTEPGTFQAGLTGLASRSTYYYRAKADGGAYGTGYGAEKSFSTSFFPPYVTTGQASGISDNSSTLHGNLYFLGSASTVNTYFVYGTTHNGPYTGTTPLQPMIAPGAFTSTISGLNSATTYYYRAMGDAGQYSNSHGEECTFTTSVDPPIVTTADAGAVTAGTATLNGSLTELGTATTVNVSFQYGATSGGPYPYATAAQAKTAEGAFQAGLSGLDANTTYYCRAKGDGGIYGISYGAEKSFTTSKIPPSVTTDNATNITASTASLNGMLSSLGTAPTVNVSFNWGTTPGVYTHFTTPQPMATQGTFHGDISGLSALTTYYYQAAANGGAHGSALGAECSFTTGTVPPTVSTEGTTFVTPTSYILHGRLQAMGTSPSDNVSFQWGTNPGVYTGQTALQTKDVPGDFTASLSGLSGATTYYYRAVASGGRHGTGFGSEHAFTTGYYPPSVTTSAATDWTTDTAFLNGELTALGNATSVNVSFIYGTSPGGPYPNSTPPRLKSGEGTFQTGITGLSPFTRYYFKARGDGGIYGISYGSEMNFTTNHLPPVMGTGGALDVMTNAAILDGNLYLMGTAAVVNASFEYGTTHGGPYIGTAQQTMSGPDTYQAQLTGLAPATTYYYRAKGDGGPSGTGYGDERTFTTGSHPPIASTSNAGSITAGSAVLNGRLLSVGTSPSDNVSFQYGTRQGGPYTSATTPQAMAAPGSFQASISGLTAHAAYYFRAVAEGGIYGAGYGREMSFITSNVPPSVITGDATHITTNAATLNGNLSSLGSSMIANVSFQWGVVPGVYTGETAAHAMSATGSYSTDLSGLTPGTTYYFRAKAVGDGTGYGSSQTFATLSPAPAPPVQPTLAPALPHGSSGQTQAVTPQSPVALPNIIVQNAYLSTGRVAPGTAAEVITTVVNKGNVRGKSAIKLYVNGRVEESRSVTLDGGKSANLAFTVTREEPDTYDVYVEGMYAGSFIVQRDHGPDIILFISSALVGAALVLACVYIWRRRQQGY
jgi:phosphodiesterase/alkaline phosphatase D-like protein